MPIDNKNATGEELFAFYTSKRDYSGSEMDTYAQLLITIKFQLNPTNNKREFFDLLVKAERAGKRLAVCDITENGTIYRDELTLSDIIFI